MLGPLGPAGHDGAAALCSKNNRWRRSKSTWADLQQAADTDGVTALSNITYTELLANNPVQRSLSAIKKAHFQLRSLKSASVTSDSLVSQIALCDLILCEISIIRAALAERFCDIQFTRQGVEIPLRCLH